MNQRIREETSEFTTPEVGGLRLHKLVLLTALLSQGALWLTQAPDFHQATAVIQYMAVIPPVICLSCQSDPDTGSKSKCLKCCLFTINDT